MRSFYPARVRRISVESEAAYVKKKIICLSAAADQGVDFWGPHPRQERRNSALLTIKRQSKPSIDLIHDNAFGIQHCWNGDHSRCRNGCHFVL